MDKSDRLSLKSQARQCLANASYSPKKLILIHTGIVLLLSLLLAAADQLLENQIGSTDNSNILHMVNLMNRDMDYAPSELIDAARDDTMFTGSFGEMLGNINAVLGNDQNSTQIMLDNYYASAVELDTNRDSISSVDLNHETVNMIQYQKSYSAACRLMTTMDEILDKLINGTGIAGR